MFLWLNEHYKNIAQYSETVISTSTLADNSYKVLNYRMNNLDFCGNSFKC